MRRLVAALGLLAVLVALAGCSSVLGPGEPDPERLNENATYEWDTDANTSYNVSRSQFKSVVTVTNRSEIRVYRRNEIGSEEPLDVAAVKFRYPNGTVTNASAVEVERTRQRTIFTLPQREGQLAFTAPRPNGKRFSTPLFVEGSHEVTLPPQARVGVPLLSQVSPPRSESSLDDEGERMTVSWDQVDRGPIVVRYYLARDLWLFGGLAAVLVSVGVGGAVYYLRQIRALERRREEIGLDVETEDDDLDDGGPPPGMR